MTPLAPQELRTFFVTSVAWRRRSIFQTDRMANLMVDVLRQNRHQSRFALHAFVIMPDHLHLLLTPAFEHSLEKCVQFIKGGFSFRATKELGFHGEIWQTGFTEHRVKDANDFRVHSVYIHQNPVRARLVEREQDYHFSSASLSQYIDSPPRHLRG